MNTALPSSPREVRRGLLNRPARLAPAVVSAQVVVAAMVAAPPTPQDIAELAYARFLARGGEHGHDVEDWLDAERTLTAARAGNEVVPSGNA